MDNNILFSQFKNEEFDAISKLLNSVFSISESTLKLLYQRMICDFNLNDWPPANFICRGSFKSSDIRFQNLYDNSPVIALDLPSTLELNSNDPSKPTVVIMGQDPRNGNNFEEIIIGTPYAFHVKRCRHKETRVYFEMVKFLLELGYRVYLTDVFKIWVADPRKSSEKVKLRAKLPRKDKARFFHLLEQELQIFAPKALITWGGEAAGSASKIKLNMPHISFLHPSGAAGGAWKKLLNSSPTEANKFEYWKSEIIKNLA